GPRAESGAPEESFRLLLAERPVVLGHDAHPPVLNDTRQEAALATPCGSVPAPPARLRGYDGPPCAGSRSSYNLLGVYRVVGAISSKGRVSWHTTSVSCTDARTHKRIRC